MKWGIETRVEGRMEGKAEEMSLKRWSEAEFAECGCGGNNLELQTEHICPGTTETQLTQISAPTSPHCPFPGENSISQSSGPAKQAGSPFLQARHGDVLRAAGSDLPRNSKSATSTTTPLSTQQAVNIPSSTMNCGFSELIPIAAATLALGKGKINVLFMLKWRWCASGVPGRLENGIILNKLLMVLKALPIDYRLCS